MADITLETERLILRPPVAEDFPAWAGMMADEEASRFIGGPLDRRHAWASMAVMAGAWSLQGMGNFSVLLKETGQWIGRAGPWMPEGWPGPEIGWAFAKAYWGKGYAREAAKASIGWARDALGWSRIIHIIHPQNLSSIALAQALGSEFINRLAEGELESPERLLLFGRKI